MSLAETWKVLVSVWGVRLGSERRKTTANRHMIYGSRQGPYFACHGRGCGIGGGERWGGRFQDFEFSRRIGFKRSDIYEKGHISHLLFPYIMIFSCCSLRCVSVWRIFGVEDCVGLLKTETWGASVERGPNVYALAGSRTRCGQ
jgi:hypothetical protein